MVGIMIASGVVWAVATWILRLQSPSFASVSRVVEKRRLIVQPGGPNWRSYAAGPLTIRHRIVCDEPRADIIEVFHRRYGEPLIASVTDGRIVDYSRNGKRHAVAEDESLPTELHRFVDKVLKAA